jgi:hypothetical protein
MVSVSPISAKYPAPIAFRGKSDDGVDSQKNRAESVRQGISETAALTDDLKDATSKVSSNIADISKDISGIAVVGGGAVTAATKFGNKAKDTFEKLFCHTTGDLAGKVSGKKTAITLGVTAAAVAVIIATKKIAENKKTKAAEAASAAKTEAAVADAKAASEDRIAALEARLLAAENKAETKAAPAKADNIDDADDE